MQRDRCTAKCRIRRLLRGGVLISAESIRLLSLKCGPCARVRARTQSVRQPDKRYRRLELGEQPLSQALPTFIIYLVRYKYSFNFRTNPDKLCCVSQAAQQLGRTTGYDPPRLLSLLHLAQWRALKAAGGPISNYSMKAVAGNSLSL